MYCVHVLYSAGKREPAPFLAAAAAAFEFTKNALRTCGFAAEQFDGVLSGVNTEVFTLPKLAL